MDGGHPHLEWSFPSQLTRFRNSQACAGVCLLGESRSCQTDNISPHRTVIETLEKSEDLLEGTYGGRRGGAEQRPLRREPMLGDGGKSPQKE